jgi:putative polyhydroxyalkanoate system protein
MSVIRANRTHNLTFEQARTLAEELVVNLAQEFGVKYHWEEETVKFKGAGAKGYLTVLEDRVELKMELGFLLNPFKSKIENSINRRLDEVCD